MCLFAFAMIGLYLGSQYVKLKSNYQSKFRNQLDNRQSYIYSEIVKERLNIFLFSLLTGITIAAGTTYLWWSEPKFNTPVLSLVCYFISVSLFICYLLYMILPKSRYILNYLDNKTQVNEWLNIYKKFRNGNYIGLVLGILVFLLISSFGLFKK